MLVNDLNLEPCSIFYIGHDYMYPLLFHHASLLWFHYNQCFHYKMTFYLIMILIKSVYFMKSDDGLDKYNWDNRNPQHRVWTMGLLIFYPQMRTLVAFLHPSWAKYSQPKKKVALIISRFLSKHNIHCLLFRVYFQRFWCWFWEQILSRGWNINLQARCSILQLSLLVEFTMKVTLRLLYVEICLLFNFITICISIMIIKSIGFHVGSFAVHLSK